MVTISKQANRLNSALAQYQARLDVLRQAEFRHEALEFGLLFDHRWYASTYLHKECSFGQALAHFLGEGLKNYHDPSLFFSTLYYAGQAEFATWPVNILEHYVREGAARGLNPCPLFDSPWYYERYEVAASGLTPLAHFVQAARQGVMHDPNEFFDTALYMEEQDVSGGGEYPHPFFHYLQTASERKQRTSQLFYTYSYLMAYEDVEQTGGNPLEHYLRHGRFESRNTAPLSITYDKAKLRLQEFRNTPADGRLVFYTAVAGDYSRLLPPAALVPGARYVCFSDLPRQTYGIWEIRPLPEMFGAFPSMANRWCKMHPHVLFPDAEIAVYTDGNVIINGDMEPYIRRVLDSGLPVGMIRHPLRDCVYEEITACIERKKDDEERLVRQKNRYLSLALPEHGGLYECNAIINNLGHPILPDFYDLWWRELSEQSRRDQVSLPYVLRTLKFAPCEFLAEGMSVRNSEDFFFILKHDDTFDIVIDETLFPLEFGIPELAGDFSEACRAPQNSYRPGPPCTVIAVVCSEDKRRLRAHGSAHIRILERIRGSSAGAHVFCRMSGCELLALVQQGAVRAGIIQRNTLPAAIWRKLKPYAESGSFRYLLDLDDDLLEVPADKDLNKNYEKYRPVLTEIIRHAAMVLVSTEPLLRKIAMLTDNVSLLPNALSRRIWVGDLPQRASDNAFRVLYMGTRTHDADLRLLMPALENVAARCPEFRLCLIGVASEAFIDAPDWLECREVPGKVQEYPLFIPWLKRQVSAFDCGIP